jgi:glycosyltransferase involved in cell wall biosynthesis
MVATFNGMAHPSTIWKKYDQKKLDRWFREVADKASIVIAVSDMTKKDLLSRVYIPEERIRVIHYGVSGEFKPMDDKRAVNAVLSKYGLMGKQYLLYVGAAEPNKNLAVLLDVFSGLSKNDGLEDMHLTLAGNPSEDYRSLSDKAEALGLAQKVIFTGQIDHDDLPAIYNGAEAFILPTIVEWFGIPVLEAMACGIPVAVSKNTGALEAVGGCAVPFDPRDPREMAASISEVLQNKSLRCSLAEKGIERVKQLSWKETARKTLAAYCEAYDMRKERGI